MKYFSLDIGNLAGTIALAFTIHTNFGPMLKCNKDQIKNRRDLGLTFFAGGLIYSMIGILGAYGILNRDIGNESSIITDYFKK